MIMQETELKITDIFRVMNYHIDCGRTHIYCYRIKICFIDLIRVRFPLQDPLNARKIISPHWSDGA